MENIHYKLRITLTHCDVAQCLALIAKQSSCYAHCVETGKQGEQPHVHFYILSNMREDTMRTQYRKLSKSAKGNKLYSLKKMYFTEGKDYALEYLAYCMKEGDFHSVQIPEDWLSEADKYDLKVKEDIVNKRIKKESRTKRIIREFDKNFQDRPNPYIADITNWLMDWFVKEECNVSVQTLTSWTNTLCLRHLSDEAAQCYRSVLTRKIIDSLQRV